MSGDFALANDQNDIAQFLLLSQQVQIFQEKLGVFVRCLNKFVVTGWTIFEHVDRCAAWDFILITSARGIMLNGTRAEEMMIRTDVLCFLLVAHRSWTKFSSPCFACQRRRLSGIHSLHNVYWDDLLTIESMFILFLFSHCKETDRERERGNLQWLTDKQQTICTTDDSGDIPR